MKKHRIGLAVVAGFFCMATAQGAEPAACKTVRIAYAGWKDNQVQNAVFANLLTALGYQPQIRLFSTEVIYSGLKANKLDVFLDEWTEKKGSDLTANPTADPYLKEKAIDRLGPDLTGAKYTLVVPAYLYNKGLTSFADIHKFAKPLDHKIYGIEPGNAGNNEILAMIKANKYQLGDFHLVQSSEAGMLAEVARKYHKKKAIVFLGWEPDSMNIKFHIKYLTGGSKYFGSDQGASKVYITVRHGYTKDCPNVGNLLENFQLSVESENHMMYDIVVRNMSSHTVAKNWLAANPAWVKKTLSGVDTFSGQPGLPAVRNELKSQ